MRIKMQCPDCGKWFTLELSVRERRAMDAFAHADSEASTEPSKRQTHGSSKLHTLSQQGADTIREIALSAAAPVRGAGRQLWEKIAAWPFRIVPIAVAGVIALLWFFMAGPGANRAPTDVVDEISAAGVGSPALGEVVGEVREHEAPEPELGPDEQEGPAADADEERTRPVQEGPAAGEDVQFAAIAREGLAERDAARLAAVAQEAVEEREQAPEPAADTQEAPAAGDDPAQRVADPQDALAGGSDTAEPAEGSLEAPAREQEDAEQRAAAMEAGDLLVLTLTATDRCYVRVTADGEVVGELTLERDEWREWTAQEEFRLFVGAGKYLDVSLNGQFLGTAGPDARVVDDLVIRKEGFRY